MTASRRVSRRIDRDGGNGSPFARLPHYRTCSRAQALEPPTSRFDEPQPTGKARSAAAPGLPIRSTLTPDRDLRSPEEILEYDSHGLLD